MMADDARTTIEALQAEDARLFQELQEANQQLAVSPMARFQESCGDGLDRGAMSPKYGQRLSVVPFKPSIQRFAGDQTTNEVTVHFCDECDAVPPEIHRFARQKLDLGEHPTSPERAF